MDESFEGRLAAITGRTKAEISWTLNELAYWNYIAEYKPEERRNLGASVEHSVQEQVGVEQEVKDAAVLVAKTVYLPLRYRNFAA